MKNKKIFQGKALYQPSGKAKEYSPWATNFFVGCKHDCDYCYCKKGPLSHIWTNTPLLKKCFKDESTALKQFITELSNHHEEVAKSGVFFSFTTDPMLEETRELTLAATEEALKLGVPVQILTKNADWLSDFQARLITISIFMENKNMIAFGFTLTGRDDLEPNASPNEERIEAMRKLHAQGFKTFASIEPVIEPLKSIEMIEATKDCSDIFKVGLMSGKKDYDLKELKTLFTYLNGLTSNRIYIKDSFAKKLFINRDKLPEHFVNVDFNIFKNQ